MQSKSKRVYYSLEAKWEKHQNGSGKLFPIRFVQEFMVRLRFICDWTGHLFARELGRGCALNMLTAKVIHP